MQTELPVHTPQDLSFLLLSLLHAISSSQSEEVKTEKAKEFIIYAGALNEKNTEQTISEQFCTQFAQLVGNTQTSESKELLHSVGIIAELGQKSTFSWEINNLNYFFEYSGLFDVVQKIMFEIYEEEREQIKQTNSFSDLLTQLILTVSNMKQNEWLDDNSLNLCGLFYKTHITNLIAYLQDNQQKWKEQGNLQRLDIISKEIDEILQDKVKVLDTFNGLAIQICNNQEIQIKFKLHLDIIKLFHINCSQDLNCLYSLFLPHTKSTQELHAIAIELLANLGHISYDEQFFQNNYFTLNHTTSLIISLQSRRLTQYGQIFSTPIASIISGSLHLMSNHFLVGRLLDMAFSSPELMSALISLSQYGMKDRKGNREEIEIRTWSNKCLSNPLKYCNQSVSNQLIMKWKLISSLIVGMSTGGGNYTENSHIILIILSNINFCITSIREEEQKFQPQSMFILEVQDQIEQEGGAEEVEAFQFHQKKMGKNNLKTEAFKIKSHLINVSKDISNERWY